MQAIVLSEMACHTLDGFVNLPPGNTFGIIFSESEPEQPGGK